jgi:hypothetical protein
MSRIESTHENQPSIASDLSRGTIWLIWEAARLPVLSFLVILEPILRFTLSTVALLGVLAAFFFRLSGMAPHFPFWGSLRLAVACVLTQMAYHALLRVLSK